MTTLETLTFDVDDLGDRVLALEGVNRPRMPYVKAWQFVDSLGVCVHLVDTTGDYASWSSTKACLDAIGLWHMRTAAPVPGGQGITAMRTAASQGYKFTFTVRNVSTYQYDDELPVIAGIDDDYPGSVVAIEGCNEVSYGSPPSGWSSWADYQSALYSDVAGVWPVLGYTGSPWVDSASDMANIHHYPRNGDQFGAKGEDFVAYGKGVGKFMVVTEAGFGNSTTSTPYAGTDDATQAKLVLNLACEGPSSGLARTFIYQLLDPSTPGTSMEGYFGLFAHPYTAKDAATALGNMIALIGDAGATAQTHENLPIRVYSASSTHRWTTFAKSDGTTIILLWRNVDIWDQTNKVAISVSPITVVINVEEPFTSAAWFDPMVGTSAQGTFTSSPISLSLGDTPLVLAITP